MTSINWNLFDNQAQIFWNYLTKIIIMCIQIDLYNLIKIQIISSCTPK